MGDRPADKLSVLFDRLRSRGLVDLKFYIGPDTTREVSTLADELAEFMDAASTAEAVDRFAEQI